MISLIVDEDVINRKKMEDFISKMPFLQLVKSCSTAIEATQILINEKIELIFLDIEMHNVNGFDLMKIIPDPKPQIILITSHREYAPEAFDFNVADFLLKPLTKQRFLKAVMKAKKIVECNTVCKIDDYDIYIKVDKTLVKLNTKDIVFIEGLSDCVTIHTVLEKFVVHSTMKGIEAKLPSNFFMRVHNSFIVRLDKISKIDENLIVIKNTLIPVSRANRSKLMEHVQVI